jgi:cytochrome b561
MENRYILGKVTVRLHWLVAIVMIVMLVLGAYMALLEAYGIYDIHKSVGVLVLPLLAVRVWWRLVQGMPAPIGRHANIERSLAKISHWGLLAGSIALPVTGMLYSGASGHGFGIFGLTLVPSNYHPSLAGEVTPYNELLSRFGETAHEWVGYSLVALIVLHVAGALKHHLIDHDGTLSRMLGKRVGAK